MRVKERLQEVFNIWEYDIFKYRKEFVYYVASALLFPICTLLAIHLGLKGFRIGGTSFVLFIIPGFVALQVLYGSLFGTAFPLLASKVYTGVSEEFLTAPINYISIVLGKMISGATKGILTSIFVLTFCIGFLGANISPSMLPLLLILLFVTGMAYAGLGMVLAMICRSFEQLTNLINLIIAPMQFFAATFFPVSALPRLVQLLVYAMPLTYTSIGTRMLMSNTFHAITYLSSLGVNAIFAITMTALALMLLKKGKGVI